MSCAPTGALIGWHYQGARQLGICTGQERDTGRWWAQQLARPWRKITVQPDLAVVLIPSADLSDALIDTARTYAAARR